MAVQRLYVEWLDINGAFQRTANYVVAPMAFPVPYITALQALSNAGIQQYSVNGVLTVLANAPAVGQYDNMYQVGQIVYQTTAPGSVRVIVPAPRAANLQADKINFNPAALAGLDIQVLTNVDDALGNAATIRTSAVVYDRRTDQQ